MKTQNTQQNIRPWHIKTRFQGATDTTGARIVATCNGKRKSISYPYELSGSETHKASAQAWIDWHMSNNGWADSSRFKLREVKSTENGYIWEIYV